MKLPFKIIALDLETTDSDFRFGEIIEIGAVIINEDLSTGREFWSLMRPLTQHRNIEAMEVNKISEDDLDEAAHPMQVLSQFEELALSVDSRPILGAWGTHFDVVYLQDTYKKLKRDYPFSYRCVDLKSIAIWEMSKKCKSPTGGVSRFLEAIGLEFEGTPHKALDDIKNVVRILQHLST